MQPSCSAHGILKQQSVLRRSADKTVISLHTRTRHSDSYHRLVKDWTFDRCTSLHCHLEQFPTSVTFILSLVSWSSTRVAWTTHMLRHQKRHANSQNFVMIYDCLTDGLTIEQLKQLAQPVLLGAHGSGKWWITVKRLGQWFLLYGTWLSIM